MKSSGSNRGTVRYRIYSVWIRALLGLLLPLSRLRGRFSHVRDLENRRLKPKKGTRVWFHAASAGELESLWPLVELASQDASYEIVLTVFSESAYQQVIRSMQRLRSDRVLFAGYSPFEGYWFAALDSVKPDLFITAKYEAWPELWAGLSLRSIPLGVIGAKARSSLLWAKRILSVLGVSIPKLLLYTFHELNIVDLEAHFPSAKIETSSDPRWDRVYQRLELPNPRVSEVFGRFANCPRPWVILGQVWKDDLKEWRNHVRASFQGTYWFVPHRVDPASVMEIEVQARDMGLSPLRTSDQSGIRPLGTYAVLVDEMGFLAELYAKADWVFIGGGFGAGVHSTIEPAVSGLKIFSGPVGSEKFDEIRLLRESRQLTVIEGAEHWKALNQWVALGVGDPKLTESKSFWMNNCSSHRGGAQRLWERIVSQMGKGIYG